MEVSLVSASGIPEGCLISVRAGATRRQAPVEAGKPCKLSFPKGVSHANPFKVDLLAPLGDATVEVSTAQEKYPFEVKSRWGKPMNLTLKVKEDSKSLCSPDELDGLHSVGQSIGENLAASTASDSPARRHQAAIEQRAYLDSHNVLPWVHGLLQDLIRDRPGDPWSYIDASTKSKLPPLPTGSGQSASSVPEQEQTDLNAQKALNGTPTDLGKLKKNAVAALLRAREKLQCDGEEEAADKNSRLFARLDQNLSPKVSKTEDSAREGPQAGSPELDELRQRAKAAFVQSAYSGSLAARLRDTLPSKPDEKPDAEAVTSKVSPDSIPEELRQRTKAAFEEMLHSGELEACLGTLPSKGHEELRLKAKAALVQSFSSGDLEARLRANRKPKEEKRQGSRSPSKVSFSEDSAANVGGPLPSKGDGNATTLEELRERTKAVFVKSVCSGQLQACLGAIPGRLDEEAPSLPSEVATKGGKTEEQLLFDKIDFKKDGILDREEIEYAIKLGLIQKPPGFGEDEDELRQRTIEAISKGVPNGDSGGTSTALGPVEDLRNRLTFELEAAVAEGRLSVAVAEAQKLSTLAETDASSRVNPGDSLNSPMNSTAASGFAPIRKDVSEKAQDALLSAAADGRLQNVLQDISVTEPRESAKENADQSGHLSSAEMKFNSVCQRTWQALTKAHEDGTLQDALCEAPSPRSQRRQIAERIFAKIDFKKDGVIDRDELENAIENGIIKRPPGFVTSREVAATTQLARSKVEPVVVEEARPMKVSSSCSAIPLVPAKMGDASKSPYLIAADSQQIHMGSYGSASSPCLKNFSPLAASLAPSLPFGGTVSPEEVRRRQELFRQDNDSLKRENARLKKLREAGDTVNRLSTQNDQLRSELGRMLTFHRKDGGFMKNSGFAGRRF